jgi:hypothetical protein
MERRLPIHEDHITVGQVPKNLLVPQAAKVVASRGKKLVCKRDTVLERLVPQIDDLTIFIFDGSGTRPLVYATG